VRTIDDILFDLDITKPCPEQARLLKAAARDLLHITGGVCGFLAFRYATMWLLLIGAEVRPC